MPSYVDEILLARYAGVTPMDLETWPLGRIHQLRIVRNAEYERDTYHAKKQNRR